MKKLFLVITATSMFLACSKYENGPEFSLRSKKERLNNNWVVMEALHNSAMSTAEFQSSHKLYQLNFASDEQYSLSYNPGGLSAHLETGQWKFNEDKTHVVLSSYDGKTITDCTILQLKENALWLRFADESQGTWELHLIPKPEQ